LSGRYQIYIDQMEPDGVGSLYVAFEQLKKKLQQEGLFNLPKKPLPLFPKRIAVVTSLDGAVIRDINTTVRRRYPIAQVVLYPTVVQGEKAAADIARQINRANERGDFDTLIIGRGGGSIEDLWPFNEEIVARAIANSKIPVISSVGHETDTTIADLVADRRAATPTAAAELATPVLTDTLLAIQDSQRRLANAMRNRIEFAKKELAKQTQSYIFQQPQRLYENYTQKVDQLSQQLVQLEQQTFLRLHNQVQTVTGQLMNQSPLHRVKQDQQLVSQLNKQLQTGMVNNYQRRQEQVQSLIRQLDSLSPLKIMGRGYSYVTKDQRVVSQAKQLTAGQHVQLHFADGQADAEITKIKEN
jgi:exodeoxyribonuclease VII large subunit